MAPSAFLHPFARPGAERFIDIVRGEGATVWDSDGKCYLDALASLWYCQIGHGRAEMADAVASQMRRIEAFHTFEMFTNEPAEQFCEEVVATSSMDSPRVFLTNSGSEAVETAIKLARLYWSWQDRPERHIVLARERAYHGVTYGATSAQGLPANREHWGPLLTGIHHARADDLDHMATLFAEHDGHVAAVIIEPVQGAAGVFPPPSGYLQGLRDLCDRHGALLVFDEVITGFGRLGCWWAADHYRVTPDLTVFAKGATSGYLPLGGVIVGRRVLEVLEARGDRWLRHGFTYSGHPTTCAAGIANLAVLRSDDLPARAEVIGAPLEAGLTAIVDDGLAAEVRGLRGIWALTMNDGRSAVDVRDEMVEHGVIPRPIGTHSLAVCPPLVIAEDELAQILRVTRDALEKVPPARGSQG